MLILLCIIAIITVVSYARYLFLEDEKEIIKYRSLEGNEVGFKDYYYCTPMDIIVLESQLWIRETVCEELI